MATSLDFIEFVCEQLSGTGDVTYKKMFGEFMIYLNAKPIFVVCNATVYVKKFPEIESLLSGSDIGFPYHGAKEHYIVDIESKELIQAIALILEKIVPIPKPKKKKTK